MKHAVCKAVRRLTGLWMIVSLVVAAGGTAAQTKSQQDLDGGRYIPTIWVDPDGCEHWVMDDGAEGFMTPHTNRQGIPVCRRGNLCGVMSADQFFASGSHTISPSRQQSLRTFFKSTAARSFIISGHTDSVASDAYNLRLSENRARSVARIAKATGANISEVRGYGERQPAASNKTAAGKAMNRRVEIICIR